MDPFSAAAGAFSVISLATQLVEKILDIRTFWRSIEAASRDVVDILNELDCVLGILQGIGRLVATSGSSDDGVLQKSLQTCGVYVRKLSACVHDIKFGIASGRVVRAWTSLRFTLRQERVRTFQGSLERVKSCLVLAQLVSQEQARVRDMKVVHQGIACIGSNLREIKARQCGAVRVRHTSNILIGGSSSCFDDRPARITQHNHPQSMSPVFQCFPQEPAPRLALESVHSVTEGEINHFYKLSVQEAKTLPPGLTNRSKRRSTNASLRQNTYRTFWAIFRHQSRITYLESGFQDDSDNINKQQQTETFLSIHPKPWLLGRGFTLSYSTSGNGWIPQLGFQFRHYNVRSEDDLIFEFCSYGNLEGVKSLLRRGDASPFDCDLEGWTPLHYAAQAYDQAICKLLIQHGASGSVLDLSNRSPLHSALKFSSWAIKTIRHLGAAVPSEDRLVSHLADTIRILVDHTDVDLSVESAGGNTFLDLVIENSNTRPLARWLLRRTPADFDVNHRNAEGRTFLMQQASCTTDFSECLNNMKDLLALGAELEARVLEKPETSPRDMDARALHFAVEFYHHPPGNYVFEKARYLLSQGADPHAMTLTGHTVTDRVLERRSIEPCRHWRRILLELGFDLRTFVRKEIDVHADVPWYASNGWDKLLLELFGFKPKFDDSTGAVRIPARPEAEILDDIGPVQDAHRSPAEQVESMLEFLHDTEAELDQGSSSDSDYQSAEEDITQPNDRG